MTRDLTPQLRRDIAMNFDHTEIVTAVVTPMQDERRLVFKIVVVIAAVCLVAILSAT